MLVVLGRRGVCLGLLALLLSYPAAAHAFCRTTTQPVPPNYNPTRGCFVDGLPLFWKGQCVGYSINQAASRNVPLDTAKSIIDGAFGRWMAARCPETAEPPGITASNLGTSTCAEVKYNPNGTNQNLIVFRDDGWPYSDPYNTLGLTTVTFNADTGEIYDADMEINASGRNLSVTDQVAPNGFDLASVVTHEAGHFFGLAHATNSKATMYASYKPGTIALRTLSSDDIDGICTIYPTSTTRSVGPSVTANGSIDATACDPTPRHGLAIDCGKDEPVPQSTSHCQMGRSTPQASVPGTLLLLALLLGSRRRSDLGRTATRT
jgi:hypothetical protein